MAYSSEQIQLPGGFNARLRTIAQNGLALGMDLSGLNGWLHRRQVARWSPFIRILNYHDVRPSAAQNFERHLRFYKSRFVPVGRQNLLDLLAGQWKYDRPGIMLTFDDGLKSQAEVAAPLLEQHGFTGWFFVPTGFIDTPRDQQRNFGQEHHIVWSRKPNEDLGAMTWDDLRRLDKNQHFIGCHTYTHVRLSSKLTAADLDREIVQANRVLEQHLGHKVDSFCWVGGEEWSYSAAAARTIREAGYRLSFMNSRSVIRPGNSLLQLHRNCVEAHEPLWYVRYVISGFRDAYFAAMRKRVNALTAE